MSADNEEWKIPEHGQICGCGITDKGRFVEIYDADAGLLRKFWNFETPQDDALQLQRMKELEDSVRAQMTWNGEDSKA